jgi:hypothetical protein
MRALGGLIEKGIYHVDGLYAIQILLGRLVRLISRGGLIAKGGLYVGLLYGRLGQPRLRSGVIFQAPAPPTTIRQYVQLKCFKFVNHFLLLHSQES